MGHFSRKIATFGLLTGLAAAGLGGCGGGSETADRSTITTHDMHHPGQSPTPFSPDQADTVANYRLSDFDIRGPGTVQGPKVYFTATNSGKEPHELSVLDAKGKALGEIASFEPGEASAPAGLTLKPGTYTLLCLVKTAGGTTHEKLGMTTKLVVK